MITEESSQLDLDAPADSEVPRELVTSAQQIEGIHPEGEGFLAEAALAPVRSGVQASAEGRPPEYGSMIRSIEETALIATV